MSTAPGSTIEIASVPVENGAGSGTAGTPETNGAVNGALARTVEVAMSASPATSVDSGVAKLAGISPIDISPSVIPDADKDPAAEPESPETAAAEAVSESPDEAKPPLFSYVREAQEALDEADSRGVSLKDREVLEAKLQHAQLKEGFLTLGAKIIQVDKEIAKAKKNNATSEELSALQTRRNSFVEEQNKAYAKIFQQIEAQEKIYKRAGRSPENVINDMILDEAISTRDGFRLSLKEAEKSGNPEEIELARLRLEAAEMHVGIIKKKKGRGIKSLIASIILAAGVTALKDGGKVTTGELTPQRGR